MTNKPMLSVERDTLEWVLNCWPKEQKGNAQEVIPSQVKELRALLDRPETPYVPKAGWSFKYVENGVIVIRNGEDWTIIKPGDGPIYEQFLYRFCEEQLNKTAAQHHGDPVAWQYRVSAGPATGWSLWHDGNGEEFKNSYQVETRPLYAERPAPVADHAQCEECKGWGYHENHHEGGGTECGECSGSGKAPVEQFSGDTVVCRRYQLEQHPGQNFYHYDLEPVYGSVPVTVSELITMVESAPVAVVLPDRLKTEPFTTIDRGSKNYKAGYNAAIAEVAKLNGLKP